MTVDGGAKGKQALPTRFVGMSEEARHSLALSLLPSASSAHDDVVALLGDPSWRVRKAMLQRFSVFTNEAGLVEPLVSSLADSENAGLRSASAEALAMLGALAVPALTRALGTPDVDQRKFVVEVLGSIGTDAAKQSLTGALLDPDNNVRSSVVDMLGRWGGDSTTKLLIDKLESHAEDLQLAAYFLDALTRLAARLSAAQLAPYLARPGLARLVYPLLGLSNDPEAATPLAQAVITGPKGGRAVAARALVRLLDGLGDITPVTQALRNQDDPTTVLTQLAMDVDDIIAECGIRLLGTLREPGLAPTLLSAASCRPFVHTAIVEATRLGQPAVRALLEAYEESDIETRVLFLEVVEQVGDAASEPSLLQIAQGIEPRTAEAAVRALAKLGGTGAIGPLIDLIKRAEVDLARQTALALAQIGTRHVDAVGDSVSACVNGGDIRAAWFFVLGALGRERDAALIVAASHHNDAEVRRAALDAFLSFKNRIDENAIVFALADENPRVRSSAARVLGGYRSDRALEALLVATRDLDPWVVAEAIRSLGHLGGPRALETLHNAVSSTSSPIAIAALAGLFRLNPPDLRRAIEAAIQHVDGEVVREALQTSTLLEAKVALPIYESALSHRSWHVRWAAADILLRRNLFISDALLSERLSVEDESLVCEALERMAERQGAGRR